MTWVRRAARAALGAIIWPLVELGSNRILLAGIEIITLLWVVDAIWAPHPIDSWTAGLPRLVLWYTLWFGLVEGATKVVQADQARRDRDAKKRMEHLLSLSQQHLDAQGELIGAIREEQDRTRERDEAAAKRDEALRVLMERHLDAICEREGGDADGAI